MARESPLWFLQKLQCPTCSGTLDIEPDRVTCAACPRAFHFHGEQLDCRVAAEVRTTLEVTVPQASPVWPPWRSPPDGIYRGPLAPRTNARHLSILASRPGQLDVMDWGCGAAGYRAPIRDGLGHRYVGVDVEGAGADVLADVHLLPFRSEGFDHVITGAVLEHVASPILAAREVSRVLRRGGVFSGSTAFLEPYHLHSHFHLSPDGLMRVLESARFEVEGLWPQEGWTVFDSLAEMPGPVSTPTRWILRRLNRFERLIRARHLHPRAIRTRRWLRRREPHEIHADLLALTGQIDFLARKT